MRKTKRFTPNVLSRFEKQGRGEGTYGEYLPWHCVTRGDPSSLGRSHLLMWHGRLRELLSDGELGTQLFATMLADIDDCLEQLDLGADDGPHVLARYQDRDPLRLYPGTVQLAKQLGIKHPMVRDRSEQALWRPTTDLLLIRRDGAGKRFAQAIAFKPDDCAQSRRKRELLSLEREFWTVRSVPWLLITPKLSDARVVLTLRRIGAWALAEPAAQDAKRTVIGLAYELPGRTVTMLRIATMNLVMHGVKQPDVHYQDTLSQSFEERHPKGSKNAFYLVLANPPFKGSLDEQDVAPDILRTVKTKKTELLFIGLILRMLKLGGRSATIVPDGVLFGLSKSHVQLRQHLIENNQLEAVISLPSGVFKPYAGVSTAIIIFAKGGKTENVFFYDVQSDGFTLDDKRTKIGDGTCSASDPNCSRCMPRRSRRRRSASRSLTGFPDRPNHSARSRTSSALRRSRPSTPSPSKPRRSAPRSGPPRHPSLSSVSSPRSPRPSATGTATRRCSRTWPRKASSRFGSAASCSRGRGQDATDPTEIRPSSPASSPKSAAAAAVPADEDRACLHASLR